MRSNTLTRVSNNPGAVQVFATTLNPSQHPRGVPRPFHCPDCSEVQKKGHVSRFWKEYDDIESAKITGHPNPCKFCFPQATQSG